MNNVIVDRHCKRAFLNTPISKSILENVLGNASHAASSKNTQPWEVSIITNKTKDQLVKIMCEKFDKNEFEDPDYDYSMDPLPDEFKARARACGYELYKLKGIDRDDKAARLAHFRENYTFFDAPVAMIFHLPMGSERGNFLDMGLFMQNVMLGLVVEGLGSCPQFSICSYSDTIRQVLGLNNRMIVCGMAVGIPDESAKVNTFIPDRLSVNKYTQWFD
ncbi:MAG: nitroreductase [Candidatus Marinamargulisbacteria bacterium]